MISDITYAFNSLKFICSRPTCTPHLIKISYNLAKLLILLNLSNTILETWFSATKVQYGNT